MTKDEASDLKSLIGRVVQCELEAERALFQKREADGKLQSYMHSLQQEKK